MSYNPPLTREEAGLRSAYTNRIAQSRKHLLRREKKLQQYIERIYFFKDTLYKMRMQQCIRSIESLKQKIDMFQELRRLDVCVARKKRLRRYLIDTRTDVKWSGSD